MSGASERDFGNFQGAKNHEDARAKIDRFRAARVEWVAIHDADKFPEGVVATIADAAGKAAIRLMASGNTPQEITAALTVNPHTLDYFDRTAEPFYSSALLDLIRAQQNLVLVPTPGVPYRTDQYRQHPSWLDRPENFEFLKAGDRAFVLASARQHLDGAEGERAARVLSSLPGKFQQLRKLGLPMALGSDAGSPLQFQSGAIWWELESWRTLGATHREALIAATENGARVLNVSDRGRLVVGSRADFVLYAGNVEDARFDLVRVRAVGKAGVVYVLDGRWVGPSN